MTAQLKKQINDLLDSEVRTAERAMKGACLKAVITLAAKTSKPAALAALNRARKDIEEIPPSRKP